jgi:hypothetical protein
MKCSFTLNGANALFKVQKLVVLVKDIGSAATVCKLMHVRERPRPAVNVQQSTANDRGHYCLKRPWSTAVNRVSFRERSGNVQGTFRERSLNVH